MEVQLRVIEIVDVCYNKLVMQVGFEVFLHDFVPTPCVAGVRGANPADREEYLVANWARSLEEGVILA